MKKFVITIIAILLTINSFALDVWDGTAASWTQGTGTVSNPYLIETAANLAYLAQKVNEGYQAQGQEVFKGKYFLMTDDFDLNNINWTPIGNVNMNLQGYYFGGIFEGWYHNIDHLKIQTSTEVCGLFGGAGDEAVIQHLSVTNGDITSTGVGVGGIIGIVAGHALVSQCSFSGTLSVSSNSSFCGAGGIAAAAAEFCLISECSFSGSITSNNNGGFTSPAGSGGIVAIAMNNASISKCYNTGNLTANAMLIKVAAGIVASVIQDSDVKVSDCYNVGNLTAGTKGGIFGMVSPINPTKNETDIEVINCYYVNTCGGTTNYGTSMSSAEMQTEQFKNQLDQDTHSFVMDNGTNNGYPIHSLVASRLNEATEVTCYTAKLSANIHKGNDDVARAYITYGIMDDPDFVEVDVDTDGYVEIPLEGLEANTFYTFNITLVFDDGIVMTSEPHYFETLDNTGITEISNSNIYIYPNPASDFIIIENAEPQQITIYSLDGRLVKTVEGSNVVDVRDLNKGVYLINIDGVIKKFGVCS